MQYVSLGSDSEIAVGSAGALTVGPFSLPAGALLVVLASFGITADSPPSVAYTGGSLTMLPDPALSATGQNVQAFKFRATSTIASGTVTATYSAGDGVRLLEVGKVEEADEDAGELVSFSSSTGLSQAFGPSTPGGNPVGIALAIHAAEVAPTVAAGSWSSGFAQAQRMGADGGPSNSLTYEIATKEYGALAAMSTTVTAGTSAPRGGAFLFVAKQSTTAPTPVRRTVWSGGRVSVERFLGAIRRTVFGGKVSRTLYLQHGSQPMYLNAADYDNLADAIAATPSYGTLYIPDGTYTAPSASGWTIDRPMRITGNISGTATGSFDGPTLAPHDAGGGTGTANSTVLTISSGDVVVEYLTIAASSAPAAVGTGDGIRITPAATISNITLEKLWLYHMGRHGIYVNPATGSVDLMVVRDVISNENMHSGMSAYSFAFPQIVGGFFGGNRLYGIFLDSCVHPRLWGVSLQNNQSDSSDATYEAQVRLKLSHAASLVGCAFEDFGGSRTNKRALVIESCVGGVIDGCHFHTESNVLGAGTNAILLTNDNSGWRIGPCQYDYVETALLINGSSNNYGNVVEPQSVRQTGGSTPASVSIPSDTHNHWWFPRAGASNVPGGLRIAPVSSSSDITTTPLKGMVIYDLAANKLKVYTGSAWETVTSA